MTGEKNRFSTTEKLWDLDDKQLKTPVHDAMVLWLMNKNNLKQLLEPHCHIHSDTIFSSKEHELNTRCNLSVRYESEKPIMSSPTFIAGYADLVVYFSFRKYISKEVCPIEQKWYDKILDIKYFEDMEKLIQEYLDDPSFKAIPYLHEDDGEYKEVKIVNMGGKLCEYTSDVFSEGIIKHKYPTSGPSYREEIIMFNVFADFWLNVMENKEYNRSYAAWMRQKNKYKYEYYELDCLIEVKPYIDSFGAVLRQLQSYKKFHRDSQGTHFVYCLFTFDNRFDDQFESQGIKVLHPPENVSKEDMMKMYGLE